jgi:hypothetical protein
MGLEAGGRSQGSIPRSLAAVSPPEAVENRKIINVSDWPKSVVFLAGSARAKKGNTLGYATHYRVTLRTARLWLWEHLIEQGTTLENAAN